MEILDEKKVVVETYQEFETILTENNNYTYIYIGNNITLESGITINENKKKIIIDGTYLNNKYTITCMNSNKEEDTITLTSNTEKVIIKNINIINPNTYGVVYIPQEEKYQKVTIEYNNITFNGTQLSYNPSGTTKVIDSNITIEETNGILAKAVTESNKVEIGGNTNIESSATSSTLFLYRNDEQNPSMTFIPNSRINITTNTKEFMSGTNKLEFNVLHDTEVNLITGNGFAPNPVYGASSVLIDTNATLNFIEKSHQRVPFWSIYNSLTVNENANLFIINSYDNTPVDNYNIFFKGTNPTITLNNPNSIIIYTKNSNIIHTTNDINFNFKLNRINFWTDSTSLTSAGDINNLPDYSWYKDNNLIQISGKITSTTTEITSHNLTLEELNHLPDLNNFSFQNKKQFSTGSSNINIHPINSNKMKITGHTESFADILIEYDNISTIVTSDETGFFELDLSSPINDNTEVKIISNLANSFIYKSRLIQTPFTGELSLMKAPKSTVFLFQPVSTSPIILPKTKSEEIKIIDSRTLSSDWDLYVHITKPLTSKNNYTLLNALIFKTFTNEIIILNEVPSKIYTVTDKYEEAEVYDITWSQEQGILLRLQEGLEVNEEYITNIIYSIK